MKTVGEVLKLSVSHVGEERPRHEIEWLIADVLGISRLDLYLQFDRPLEESELSLIRPQLARLKKGEPLAYVRGQAPFFKDEFFVSQDVLIPRPETELLVEKASLFLASKKTPGTLFDICTGSGCIGLSIKKQFPLWNIVLSDISEEALAIAKKNAQKLSLSVEFLLGDLLEPFHTKADCIVANPPYLSQEEWETGDSSVKQYEPKLALLGGKTGLEWYDRFFTCVKEYIHPDGCIFVEIGSTQGPAVIDLIRKHNFSEVTLFQDLSGHDRVIKTTSRK